MFGSFSILAGDFKKGSDAQFLADVFVLPVPGKWFRKKSV